MPSQLERCRCHAGEHRSRKQEPSRPDSVLRRRTLEARGPTRKNQRLPQMHRQRQDRRSNKRQLQDLPRIVRIVRHARLKMLQESRHTAHADQSAQRSRRRRVRRPQFHEAQVKIRHRHIHEQSDAHDQARGQGSNACA